MLLVSYFYSCSWTIAATSQEMYDAYHEKRITRAENQKRDAKSISKYTLRLLAEEKLA